jgi:hypothetical protein
MDSGTVFVGLDYHSASVQVCVLDDRGRVLSNRPCANDAAAIRARAAVISHDTARVRSVC